MPSTVLPWWFKSGSHRADEPHMPTAAPALPSDRQLFAAVTRGSDAAWDELLARHLGPLRGSLRGWRERRALDSALVDLRDELISAGEVAEGEPAVRSFRPRVIAAVFGGSYGPGTSSAVDGAEVLATAFARLPEPWQTVLWHRTVEHLDDAAIAPLVGRPADAVAGLLAEAQRGLTHAFLVETEGRIPEGIDVTPLADVIDQHLAAVIVPRLTGRAAHDQPRVRGPLRRRLSARMI